MIGRHLTPEQLVAFRDHESDDREAREHLSVCGTCRERLSDTRMMTFWLRAGEAREPTSHPEIEVLGAYLDGALDRSDADAVEAHVRTCESCVARIIHLRKSLRGRTGTTASPHLLERARRQLRTPHPRFPLGRAVVEAAGGAGLRFRYQPESAARMYAALPAAVEAAPLRTVRSPAAASSRRARIGLRFRRLEEQPVEASMIGSVHEASFEHGLGKTLDIDAGPVRLTLEGRLGTVGAELKITALNVGTNELAAGLELTLIPEHGAPLTVTTDAEGRAGVELQKGESRLRIYSSPTFELILRY